MKQLWEQEGGKSQQLSDELLKALIEKVAGSGTAIEEIKEQLKKSPDPTDILKEIGKRIGDQDKRFGKLDECVGNLGTGLGRVEEEIKSQRKELSFPVDSISTLRVDLRQHAELFEKPLKKEIHFRHFLGKPLLALIVSFLIIAALVVLLTQAYGRVGQHTENDVKWRYLNVAGDPGLSKVLDSVDQTYKINPEQFEKYVAGEEDRQHKLFEASQREKSTQEEIRKLEGEKKN